MKTLRVIRTVGTQRKRKMRVRKELNFFTIMITGKFGLDKFIRHLNDKYQHNHCGSGGDGRDMNLVD